MTFLSPLLLFGTLAIAGPIIIHLLARRQIRRVTWAAMRFLKVAVERNQRRMNIEDIILMCLRCLIFLLMALALARPALWKGSALGFRGRDEVAFILIDASLSMARSDGVESAFQQAQDAAEQVLDALPAGAPAAVWLVTDGINPLTSEPTKDAGLNRKLIREAERSDRANDWPNAIRAALEKISTQSASVKQVFVITDGQALGWNNPAEMVSLIKESGKGVLTRIVLVGETDTHNTAVTDVRLASALAVVNEPLAFEAEVTNFGPDPVNAVSVNIGPDANPPVEEQVIDEIKPGTAKRVQFKLTFREPGIHTVTVRQRADRCPADDGRALAVHVLDEINVLLVEGEPGAEPRDSEVFYLRNALVPVPPEIRDRYVIKSRVITESELPSLTFETFDAVVLANVVDLSPTTTNSLVNYVRSGGGLLVFPGDRANLGFYNDKLHREQSLLPAAFGEIRGQSDAKEFATLQAQDYVHPIVSLWNDAAAGSLAIAHFFRRVRLSPGIAVSEQKAGPPLVVLAYADGEPAVVERTFGDGRVVQFSSTADSAWNDLCVRPLFVPLIHRTLGALIGRHDEHLNVPAGVPFSSRMALELGDESTRISLAGDPIENAIATPIRVIDGTPKLTFTQTDRAGGYEIRVGDDAFPGLRFAVQFDPAESKLDLLAPSDLKALESIAQVSRSTTASSLRETLTKQRNGTELWLPLAWVALGLAIAETVFGNLWSRSK